MVFLRYQNGVSAQVLTSEKKWAPNALACIFKLVGLKNLIEVIQPLTAQLTNPKTAQQPNQTVIQTSKAACLPCSLFSDQQAILTRALSKNKIY